METGKKPEEHVGTSIIAAADARRSIVVLALGWNGIG
jgi:hypothetical protein